MSSTGTGLSADVLVTDEVVSIVVRASELGYSPWRVGIALRVPPMELAWICAHLNEQDARRQILGRSISRRALADPARGAGQELVERTSGGRPL